MPSKTVFVSSLAVVSFTARGTRSTYKTPCRVDYPVEIQTIDDAPIVLEAKIAGGLYAYRTHEGELYRPLIDETGAPATYGAEGLDRTAVLARAEAHGDRNWERGWADDPFGRRVEDLARWSYVSGRYQIAAYEEVDGKVHDDPRRMVAGLGAKVATDLIEIGGVMHVRTVEPVWALFGNLPRGGVNRVALWMPDVPYGAAGGSPVVCVDLDKEWEAEALAVEINAQAATIMRSRDILWNGPVMAVNDDCVVTEGYAPSSSAESLAVGLLADQISSDLDQAKLKECSLAKLRWFVDLTEVKEAGHDGSGSMADLQSVFGRLEEEAGLPVPQDLRPEAVKLAEDKKDRMLAHMAIPELWLAACRADLGVDADALRM